VNTEETREEEKKMSFSALTVGAYSTSPRDTTWLVRVMWRLPLCPSKIFRHGNKITLSTYF
jgi:hypothetical protein